MHKYAQAIGWPVPLLEKILSSTDLAEAMAYDLIEPCGHYRGDIQAGIIASTFANMKRPPNSKPFRPSDFLPRFDLEEEKTDLTEHIKEAFKLGDIS